MWQLLIAGVSVLFILFSPKILKQIRRQHKTTTLAELAHLLLIDEVSAQEPELALHDGAATFDRFPMLGHFLKCAYTIRREEGACIEMIYVTVRQTEARMHIEFRDDDLTYFEFTPSRSLFTLTEIYCECEGGVKDPYRRLISRNVLSLVRRTTSEKIRAACV